MVRCRLVAFGVEGERGAGAERYFYMQPAQSLSLWIAMEGLLFLFLMHTTEGYPDCLDRERAISLAF